MKSQTPFMRNRFCHVQSARVNAAIYTVMSNVHGRVDNTACTWQPLFIFVNRDFFIYFF